MGGRSSVRSSVGRRASAAALTFGAGSVNFSESVTTGLGLLSGGDSRGSTSVGRRKSVVAGKRKFGRRGSSVGLGGANPRAGDNASNLTNTAAAAAVAKQKRGSSEVIHSNTLTNNFAVRRHSSSGEMTNALGKLLRPSAVINTDAALESHDSESLDSDDLDSPSISMHLNAKFSDGTRSSALTTDITEGLGRLIGGVGGGGTGSKSVGLGGMRMMRRGSVGSSIGDSESVGPVNKRRSSVSANAAGANKMGRRSSISLRKS